ncbi:transcription factor bHLH162-like [Silene latifolia]|uniref:transcription factor bHLH162-like n=1 Tax=Silene latifolia TaxID=37657 RepID=UPI003D76E983
MEENSSKPSSKVARKIIEKNRRIQMKDLYSQLNSLVTSSNNNASSSSKGPKSLPDQIDQATNYIKKLQEDVENLKKTKESALHSNANNNVHNNMLKSRVKIDVHENGSELQVVFITGSDCQIVFTQFIRILHEEHAEVLNASYSVDNNMVFHNINAKIGEGSNIAQINERLNMYSP